jgi:thioredoxin 1
MSYNAIYAEKEPTRTDVDAMTGVTAIEFGAPWCPHCIGAQPFLEAVLAARGDVRHLKIEDGPGRLLGRSFRVKLWPSVIVMRDGVELARVVRPTSQEEIARALTSL